jgi:hypothetical protein
MYGGNISGNQAESSFGEAREPSGDFSNLAFAVEIEVENLPTWRALEKHSRL